MAEGDDLLFVPILGRQLLRLWWTTKPPGNERVDYMFGVASGLKASVGDVALYADFVEPVLRRGPEDPAPAERHRRRRWEHSVFGNEVVRKSGFEVALATRYGIGVDAVREFGRFLRNLPTEPTFAWHPIADLIIARDCADVMNRSDVLSL